MIDTKSLENFMTTFNLESLIKKPTCFQFSNPTCLYLILTNRRELFKNTDVIEAEISDHHSLITTALKSLLLKGNAKTKVYRAYSSFNIDYFKEDLYNNLKKKTVLLNIFILKIFFRKSSINMHPSKKDIKI